MLIVPASRGVMQWAPRRAISAGVLAATSLLLVDSCCKCRMCDAVGLFSNHGRADEPRTGYESFYVPVDLLTLTISFREPMSPTERSNEKYFLACFTTHTHAHTHTKPSSLPFHPTYENRTASTAGPRDSHDVAIEWSDGTQQQQRPPGHHHRIHWIGAIALVGQGNRSIRNAAATATNLSSNTTTNNYLINLPWRETHNRHHS